MNKTFRSISVVLLLITALTIGGEHFSKDKRPLTVCELLAASSVHNGKVVTVRGVQVSTDEGAWLKADSCAPTSRGLTGVCDGSVSG